MQASNHGRSFGRVAPSERIPPWQIKMTRIADEVVRNSPTSRLVKNKAVNRRSKTKTGINVKTPAEVFWD